jgi:hypothetical protein
MGLQMPLTKPEMPTRNQIQNADVKRWSKHWKVDPEQIQAAMGKVGNSVAAVEKQLGLGKLEERSTAAVES